MEAVEKLTMMMMVMVVVLPGVRGSILLSDFGWEDCGLTFARQPLVSVQKLNVSSPLTIPGQLKVHELEAHILQPLPADTTLQFVLQANSSFGPDYPKTIPCFQQQGGSCSYNACDMITLISEASSVRRQIVNALRSTGLSAQCPVSASSTLSLRDVTLDIPSMLHTPMDSFINTNNYYLTAKLLSANGTRTVGCVKMQMPVHKPCQGWLCPKDIDTVIDLIVGK